MRRKSCLLTTVPMGEWGMCVVAFEFMQMRPDGGQNFAIS